MGWEGGGRPGVGELDPAATAATLSPGGVMITTPAGPGRAERAPPPFSSRRAGILRLHFIYIILKSKLVFTLLPRPRVRTLLRRCGEHRPAGGRSRIPCAVQLCFAGVVSPRL